MGHSRLRAGPARPDGWWAVPGREAQPMGRHGSARSADRAVPARWLWTTTAVAAKVDSSYGGRGRWQRCMHAVDELWRKNAPAAAAVDRGRGQGGHRRPGWTRNTATVEEGDGNGKGLGRWWPRRM
uniref:Uncharacterized protein n=1 Tax=Oryza sativa subsp. japonica TaxID=39947 RepID=Q654M0_ORYSJ|nr:hypothetical protein [Oryza sativa Japonica Group]BAD45741.1 hypothetical protein [Oryza sativa Japonica Group]